MIESKELIKKISRPEPDGSMRSGIFRFDRNERTTLFSNSEFNDMLATLTPYDFVAYGELEPFYEKITEWLGLKRENVLLTSGSDSGIKAVFEAFVDKGDKVLNLLPNYAMFSEYTKMFGGGENKVFYENDLALDVDGFLNNIDSNTKLVIISNPGHTGTVVEESDLVRITEAACNSDALMLLDEAYYHFYPKSMIGYINQFDNLVITRTFSKAFGLASLRIGLLIGCKEVIRELYRVKIVHEITGVAAKIGTYMLNNMQIMDNYVEQVNESKEIFYELLGLLDFKVLKSCANFVYFKTPSTINAEELILELQKEKIFIKGPFNNHPFDGHCRITVGDVNQTRMLCGEIKRIISRRESLK